MYPRLMTKEAIFKKQRYKKELYIFGLLSISANNTPTRALPRYPMACAYLGMEIEVFMVKSSSRQKPYRKAVMESFGAKVVESPSPLTSVGRNILANNPGRCGSLGIAIGEAV